MVTEKEILEDLVQFIAGAESEHVRSVIDRVTFASSLEEVELSAKKYGERGRVVWVPLCVVLKAGLK